MSDPQPCALCHEEPAVAGSDLCQECGELDEYWRSLTPSERQAEDEAIAMYVEESRMWT